MKRTEYSIHLCRLLVCLLPVCGLRAQGFVNGSFENNSATPNTNYLYMPVAQFEGMVPGCYSAGSMPNIDLISTFGLLVPQGGDWYVGITPQDMLTLELAQDLVAGQTYTITFFDRCKEIAYPIDIGLSQDPHDFGDWIYTTPQAPSLNVWSERTFAFVAPNNGRYISVRQQLGDDVRAWASVDYFVMELFECETQLDAGPDQELCPGQSVQLGATGSAFDAYLWSDQSTEQTHTVSEPGVYWVVGTQGVCKDTDTVVVAAAQVPEALFDAVLREGCAPLPVTFGYTGQAQPGYTYQWTMDNGDTYTGASAMHVFTQEGCHDVSLKVTNAQGCGGSQTLAQYVCVFPSPVAAFGYAPQPVFVDNPQVYFSNASTGHVASVWDLGDGTPSTEENPEHTYALGEGGDYPVRLAVVSDLGCTDTAWGTVTVKFRFELFVPNAFTPDGDYQNPVFMPLVSSPFDVAEYRLRIYDRWGGEQFSTTDILQGWDGTLNGKSVPEGIYLWKISVRDPYSQRGIERTGRVTLVR